MNNVVPYVLLILSMQQTKSAAENKYDFYSSKLFPLTVLQEDQYAAWSAVYIAINQDDFCGFKKHVHNNLINKAKFTRICSNTKEYVDARTLVEILIEFSETPNRAQMLGALLQNGAHTRSTYTVSCNKPNYLIKHYAPIFQAIIKGNVKAFEQLWLADHAVSCDATLHDWFPEEEIKPIDDLSDFIMIDRSSENVSQELVHPLLEQWTSPEKKIHDPFLAEHDFVVVEGTADKIPHEKSIRGFLMLLKDMIENQKKYPKGTPMRYHEDKPYDLPPLHAIRSMLSISQTEPQKGLYSSLAKSFSDVSSLFFWK